MSLSKDSDQNNIISQNSPDKFLLALNEYSLNPENSENPEKIFINSTIEKTLDNSQNSSIVPSVNLTFGESTFDSKDSKFDSFSNEINPTIPTDGNKSSNLISESKFENVNTMNTTLTLPSLNIEDLENDPIVSQFPLELKNLLKSKVKSIQEIFETRLQEEQYKRETKQKVIEKFNEKRIDTLRIKLKESVEEKERYQKLYTVLQEKSAIRHSEISGSNKISLEDKISTLEEKLKQKEDMYKMQMQMMRNSWISLKKNIQNTNISENFETNLEKLENGIELTPQTTVSNQTSQNETIESNIIFDSKESVNTTPANSNLQTEIIPLDNVSQPDLQHINQLEQQSENHLQNQLSNQLVNRSENYSNNHENSLLTEEVMKMMTDDRKKFETEVLETKQYFQQQASALLRVKLEFKTQREEFDRKMNKLKETEDLLAQKEKSLDNRFEEIKLILDKHEQDLLNFELEKKNFEQTKIEYEKSSKEIDLYLESQRKAMEEKINGINSLYIEGEAFKKLYEDRYRVFEKEYIEKMERIASREKVLLSQKQENIQTRLELDELQSKHGDLDSRFESLKQMTEELNNLENELFDQKVELEQNEKQFTNQYIKFFIENVVGTIEKQRSYFVHNELLKIEEDLNSREASMESTILKIREETDMKLKEIHQSLLDRKYSKSGNPSPKSSLGTHETLMTQKDSGSISPIDVQKLNQHQVSPLSINHTNISAYHIDFNDISTPKQPKKTHTFLENHDDFLTSLRNTFKIKSEEQKKDLQQKQSSISLSNNNTTNNNTKDFLQAIPIIVENENTESNIEILKNHHKSSNSSQFQSQTQILHQPIKNTPPINTSIHKNKKSSETRFSTPKSNEIKPSTQKIIPNEPNLSRKSNRTDSDKALSTNANYIHSHIPYENFFYYAQTPSNQSTSNQTSSNQYTKTNHSKSSGSFNTKTRNITKTSNLTIAPNTSQYEKNIPSTLETFSILQGEDQTYSNNQYMNTRTFNNDYNTDSDNINNRNPFPLPTENVSHILNHDSKSFLISPKLANHNTTFEHPLYATPKGKSNSKINFDSTNLNKKKQNSPNQKEVNQTKDVQISNLEYRLLQMGKELRSLNEEWKNLM